MDVNGARTGDPIEPPISVDWRKPKKA